MSSMSRSATVFDLTYTDRPIVYDTETGVRVPRNGFKNCGNCYIVDDVWAAEEDAIERYALTPDEVLRLKLCFDRINRGSKKAARHGTNAVATAAATVSPQLKYWQSRRERLRALFNAKYFRLDQLAVRTRYRYNMRPYIVTPPIQQCTHQYYTMLRRLCRLDGLSPGDLQEKRVFVQNNDEEKKRWVGGGSQKQRRQANAVADRASRQKLTLVNDDSLQRLWKALNETELMNKNIKDQTQGGKSFLKQVVVPGKMLNCLYGKVLPDPTLRPDEIGIPDHVMEGAFEPSDTNKVVGLVKRDPVFSSDAVTMFTRVVRNPYAYITLPSEIITNKQLDYDGDNVSVMMVHSGRCFVESLLRLSAKLSMYCHFYRTRLTFSQTNGFRIAGLLRHIRESVAAGGDGDMHSVTRHFGRTFAHCHYVVHAQSNVAQQLGETLLSLSQQYGPFVAYGFLMNVRSLSFTGYNNGRIYPVGPDPRVMALHIAESGSKGTREAVGRMFDASAGVTGSKQSRSVDALEYAKTFIEAKTLIRKQGHNAKKLDSAFQNIVVDHDGHMTVRVNNTVHDLGHIVNYLQREWVMSDLTARTLLDGVFEDEIAMRDVALRCDHGEQIDGPPFGSKSTDRNIENDGFFKWDDVIEEALYKG